ncbi:MAG TPA: DUF3105 domain-containing protein [Solirubrobacterales bacterium]|jgi:hypothetical protein|nr:DUF3105 domain-containing protein [Solirubrobacterales bacterium]
MKKRALPVLVAGLLVLSGCGGSGGDGNSDGGSAAHINAESGSTNGAILDERVGSTPPPAKQVGLVEAAEKANCYLLRKVPPEDDKEISATSPAPEYSKDPPMFGPHFASPHQQADGAYLTMPEEPATVASLNHGRMLIQYAPDLPEEIQLELKGLYDTMYGGTLFFPNNTMEYAVAATTWGNLLGCTSYEGAATLNAIRAFGKASWGKYGSVPVDKFPVEGPTPAKPEEAREAKSD